MQQTQNEKRSGSITNVFLYFVLLFLCLPLYFPLKAFPPLRVFHQLASFYPLKLIYPLSVYFLLYNYIYFFFITGNCFCLWRCYIILRCVFPCNRSMVSPSCILSARVLFSITSGVIWIAVSVVTIAIF